MDGCEEYERLISTSDAGAQAHLATCARCQAWKATSEEALRLAALQPISAEEQAALDQVHPRTRAAFRALMRPRPWAGLRVAAIAAASALSLVTMLNLRSRSEPVPAPVAEEDSMESTDLAEWALGDPLEDDDAEDDLSESLGQEFEETEQTP